MQLQGKNVLFIGGFGGIGEKCVEAFLKSSVKSMLIFDLKPNEEYLTSLKDTYKNALVEYIPVDVAQRKTIVKAYSEAKAMVGTFDVVVNGAGIVDEHNADLVVSINLTGLINSCLIAMEYMSKMKGGQGGCIVNISSTAGLDPAEMFCIYSATKCGVTAFSRALANPIYFDQTGVSFVTICPGATITPMVNSLESKMVLGEYMPNFMEVFKQISFQSAQDLADQLIDILKKAENGTTWVIEGGQVQEIQFTPVWHPLLESK